MDKRRFLVGFGILLAITGALIACFAPGGFCDHAENATIMTPLGSITVSGEQDSVASDNARMFRIDRFNSFTRVASPCPSKTAAMPIVTFSKTRKSRLITFSFSASPDHSAAAV